MLIKQLQIKNLLSYGPEAAPTALGSLNVLIGPNGSGKSNFLEALALLQAAPDQITSPIRDGGGLTDWLHKAAHSAAPQDAWLEALIARPGNAPDLRFGIAFHGAGGRFEISNEYLENEDALPGQEQPYFYYRWRNGHPVLNTATIGSRKLQRESIQPDKSILAQKRDVDVYPELTWVGDQLRGIRLYREWTFGRYAAPRQPQKTDLPNDRLEQDSANLGLIINRLRMNVGARRQLVEALKLIYSGIEDIDVKVAGGTAQVFLIEANGIMPATRLSDGTLRYLSLLALLCDPAPPPLIAIEEPELGLHPDVLPSLARLLIDASSRTQIIATTHAPALIDALSETPESVLVCERNAKGTQIERLDPTDLQPWLASFRLGELWTRGEIGGTRW